MARIAVFNIPNHIINNILGITSNSYPNIYGKKWPR